MAACSFDMNDTIDAGVKASGTEVQNSRTVKITNQDYFLPIINTTAEAYQITVSNSEKTLTESYHGLIGLLFEK